jgi:hypothetical protein
MEYQPYCLTPKSKKKIVNSTQILYFAIQEKNMINWKVASFFR